MEFRSDYQNQEGTKGSFSKGESSRAFRSSQITDEAKSMGRVPPHNMEAERSVLGAILLQPEAFHKVADVGLESRDFYRDNHQKIFEILQYLSERGEPVDLVTLIAALRDRGWYESIGGTATLTGLHDDSFKLPNIAFYAKIVREKAILRRMIDTATDIASEAYDGVEDLEQYIDGAEQKIYAVSDVKHRKSFSTIQDVLVKNMNMIEELAQRGEQVTGTPTGFVDFDLKTSGLKPGQLIIVAGRPAMGKTSLVLSMAQYAAVNKKQSVVIFSLEMSEEELGMRLLSGVTRIDAKKLKIGRLNDRDWPRLAQGADMLSKSRIILDDSGDLTVMDMRAKCRRIATLHKKLDLIIVDYLQLMKGSKASRSGGGANREQEISEISRGLKALAKELGVPIIALSQLNRGLEQRPDKRPMLSDLRESGAIEQDADMVCFVYRDEVYNKETEDKGIAELIIAKHRAGDTGIIRLAWLADYTLFANLAQDAPGMPVSPNRTDRGDITL